MIDAHVHTWTLNPRNAAWLARSHRSTRRSFPEDALIRHLDHEQAAGCIVVQSQDDLDETMELVDLAGRQPMVRGVVGYVPLHRPDVLEASQELLAHRALVGIRSLGKIDPDDETVGEALTILASEGLALDLVGHSPTVLEIALRVGRSHPDLHVVVDHMGNAHLSDRLAVLERVRRLSDVPNVFVKASGLGAVSDEEFTRWLLVFVEAIGPERVMFGSDWPICLRHGDPLLPLRRMEEGTTSLADGARDRLFATTALAAYPRLAGRVAVRGENDR